MHCRVVYGDREVQDTLRRLSETIDLKDVMRMMSGVGLPEPPPVRCAACCCQGGARGMGCAWCRVEDARPPCRYCTALRRLLPVAPQPQPCCYAAPAASAPCGLPCPLKVELES